MTVGTISQAEREPSKIVFALRQAIDYINGSPDITALSATVAALSAAVADIGYGKFSVNRNGSNQTSMTAGANNKIAFNHKVYDPNNLFDAVSNFRYQPLKAGYYRIGVGVVVGATANIDAGQANIFKNGSIVTSGNYLAAPNSGVISWAHDIISMNGTTDYVEGFAYLPTGITSISGDTNGTKMFGYRVSPP